ncbi:ABC transporter permease subunit [Niameybacter massiliensis]|uniref:ABC transporter permease subunit n=1 Tax=Holtiella tumoricola TaxID=3018743 RepID=A0AA42DMX4_9FIRM|nr:MULTISPECIES: ABC transporter permease subunit [Lachnospirales]MDA3731919.1 ABC transporter permease subunit [Holtiella tumoricola]
MSKRKARLKREAPFYIMLAPGMILTLIFSYIPMFGLVMAFQNFNPGKGFLGSDFVGLQNFKFILNQPNIWRVTQNTLFIACSKMVLGILVPLLLALLINELAGTRLKKIVQTSFFLPYFLSWAIIASVIFQVFSLNGPINSLLEMVGADKVSFFTDNAAFPWLIIFSDTWKGMGMNIVIYLAAITNIDQSQYEAAVVDGANRLQQVRYITFPSILPIVILTITLALGCVLNAGFDQIYLLYNPLVYESADILDTFVFRLGIGQKLYSPAAALGFIKSLITCGLTGISYYLAYRFAGYKIF